MALEARIGKLEKLGGIGFRRPWPAAWGGTPEQDAALAGLLKKEPNLWFASPPPLEDESIQGEMNQDEAG
ncbi:MAG: hypothetical protein LBU64_13890 [Planctomycetota bacterium]|jgi:hypothetical protein|nr:hypothetical protein [Planctomycetota bacterium]